MTKVVERPEVDLVVIASPNFLHKEATTPACKSGENVVCTKPPARNSGEATMDRSEWFWTLNFRAEPSSIWDAAV